MWWPGFTWWVWCDLEMLEGLEPVLSFLHVLKLSHLVLSWQPVTSRRCETEKLGNQRAGGGGIAGIISGSMLQVMSLVLTVPL